MQVSMRNLSTVFVALDVHQKSIVAALGSHPSAHARCGALHHAQAASHTFGWRPSMRIDPTLIDWPPTSVQ
jgi:hypothetical protein